MLYKYRTFNDNNLDALKKNCFWAASVETLNDSFENEISTEKVKTFIDLLYKLFPKRDKQIKRIESAHNNLLLRIKNNIGVYSLSKNELDNQMVYNVDDGSLIGQQYYPYRAVHW